MRANKEQRKLAEISAAFYGRSKNRTAQMAKQNSRAIDRRLIEIRRALVQWVRDREAGLPHISATIGTLEGLSAQADGTQREKIIRLIKVCREHLEANSGNTLH